MYLSRKTAITEFVWEAVLVESHHNILDNNSIQVLGLISRFHGDISYKRGNQKFPRA